VIAGYETVFAFGQLA